MKLLIVLMFLSTTVFAQSKRMGASLLNKKTGEKIIAACLDDSCKQAQFFLEGKDKELKALNNHLFIPLGDDEQTGYYRFGIFVNLTEKITTSRPPYPFTIFLLNMTRVTKKLREAFPAMVSGKEEDMKKIFSFSKANFKHILLTLQSFQTH